MNTSIGGLWCQQDNYVRVFHRLRPVRCGLLRAAALVRRMDTSKYHPARRVTYDDLTFLEKSKCWPPGSRERAELERKAVDAGETVARHE